MSTPKVCIGYMRGHQVTGAFSESLLSTVIEDLRGPKMIDGRVMAAVCAHYFNIGRNALMQKLMRLWGDECEIFVNLDTDHDWSPEDVFRMVAMVDPVHRPVVSGLYHACDELGEQVRPVVLRRQGEKLEAVWDLPENDFVECDVIGEGFRAVHVSVLKKIQAEVGPHWFDFDETEHGRFMPEDNAFCARVQKIAGARIYVHTGLDIGHDKTVRLRAKDRKQKAIAPIA